MRNYAYRARNLTGRIVEGTIQAKDSNAAHDQLTEDKLIPIEIRQATESMENALFRMLFGRIRAEDIILFTRQVATMLKAGIPIVQSIEILREQAENRGFKQVLIDVSRSLTAGSSLSESLAEFPRVFTPEYVNIVVSGESGGDLVKALFSLAQWMERELEIRTAIKAALRYPIMVVIALILAMIIMVAFVLPRFTVFFAKSTVPLPLPTRILVTGNNLFQHYWPILLVLVISGGVAWWMLLRNKSIRLMIDKMKFNLYLLGPVYTKIVVARFGRIFAMLVRNGVPVLRALEIAPSVVANAYFKQLLVNVRQTIQDGNTIADGFFNEMPIFPPLVTSLIAVGEKTGSLDDMLDQVVDFYDMEINYTMKNLTTMIEPVITLVIGVGVLFLALAILLPIWNMSQVLTNQAR
ncbi:MAG: type II secretion system F family protein [Verrucomicrobia bacterium]|nr:type II secretion system F family protein [Verrucomicrobiota bacterium]MBU4291091.1 type II secretion system F family protein [Verrucomicrobiota bacterium]MBU4429359.1 type II secretion system F family protein [Verrucomicrobiota bacterium]MBU4498128.1 type II secretion system F family protein [Verrucomicrobiota bacterium]MCG2680108.1 type II secretion system F family protein [Kiritimatiellia bacterium]